MKNNIMSNLFTLNYKDFAKGAILAVITAILTYLQQALSGMTLDIKVIGTVALTALIAYLLKNLGTNSSGSFLGVTK